MTYNFELLDDERFQQFAQALLAATFPKIQCLPVGMPDGGRDAFLMRHNGKKGAFYAFQVKFSRDPSNKNEREVIEELVKSEGEKVAKLISKGCKAYYLITNVRGTSHLDAGSIDRANEGLSKAFGIECYCWWRDDLSARLDGNGSVKWNFPEILRGTDVLQFVSSEFFKQQHEQRLITLRSYITTQYTAETEVKFKQIELRNRLLALFVDVPLRVSSSLQSQYRFTSSLASLTIDPDFLDRSHTGAADFLLAPPQDESFAAVLLEGAPGQGKSTVTQYVCQVHRIRLLDLRHEIAQMSSTHLKSPLKIPFKVDLRDYATWMTGINPFTTSPLAQGTLPSLESFITSQVNALSGGMEFGPSDLIAVVRNGEALIVLDGFDEVADVPLRRRMVEEIQLASARLRNHNKNLQIVVTSRPAAFANSPGFPSENWLHTQLTDLTVPNINQYARKWASARDMGRAETEDLVKLLAVKLEQPHLRDLARSPMQLAILLALMHTSGASLPDKRTFLYDNYMRLFFNRESEKSDVVRENRELLEDLHRYLAWFLQCEAEKARTSGNIGEEELKDLVRAYLRNERHDPALADELFTGMVERVVALVSRVQGTYEFEVQPIREYFAARHLYDTAPYSPVGDEKVGTKPDRLTAIARNSYWLNVTRFYCGCYSKGELAALASELAELTTEDGYSEIGLPRTLALMLLADWVFTQQPSTVSQVVQLVAQSPAITTFVGSQLTSNLFDLPERCGRKELADLLFDLFSSKGASAQYLSNFSRILRRLGSGDQRRAWVDQHTDGDALTWLHLAAQLGYFDLINADDLPRLFAKNAAFTTDRLIATRRWDLVNSDPAIATAVLNTILDHHYSPVVYLAPDRVLSWAEFISVVLSPASYGAFRERALRGHHGTYSYSHDLMPMIFSRTVDLADNTLVGEFVEEAKAIVNRHAHTASRSPRFWDEMVASAVRAFGSRRVIYAFAMPVVGVRSTDEGKESSRGWADLENICSHIRFSRKRSGDVEWWRRQIELVEGEFEATFAVVASLLSWGSLKAIVGVEPLIDPFVASLDGRSWRDLNEIVDQTFATIDSGHYAIRAKATLGRFPQSSRICVALSARADTQTRLKILSERPSVAESADPQALRLVGDVVVNALKEKRLSWREGVALLKSAISRGAVYAASTAVDLDLPEDIAKEVIHDGGSYPPWLVQLADAKLSARQGLMARKVGDIAAKEGWFSRHRGV